MWGPVQGPVGGSDSQPPLATAHPGSEASFLCTVPARTRAMTILFEYMLSFCAKDGTFSLRRGESLW